MKKQRNKKEKRDGRRKREKEREEKGERKCESQSLRLCQIIWKKRMNHYGNASTGRDQDIICYLHPPYIEIYKEETDLLNSYYVTGTAPDILCVSYS